jgi:hypothetical protein
MVPAAIRSRNCRQSGRSSVIVQPPKLPPVMRDLYTPSIAIAVSTRKFSSGEPTASHAAGCDAIPA